jgi:hypothetical protein
MARRARRPARMPFYRMRLKGKESNMLEINDIFTTAEFSALPEEVQEEVFLLIEQNNNADGLEDFERVRIQNSINYKLSNIYKIYF